MKAHSVSLEKHDVALEMARSMELHFDELPFATGCGVDESIEPIKSILDKALQSLDMKQIHTTAENQLRLELPPRSFCISSRKCRSTLASPSMSSKCQEHEWLISHCTTVTVTVS